MVLILADGQDTLAPGVSYDEFGQMSATRAWSVRDVARWVAAERGFEGDIVVAPSIADADGLVPGAVVIDLGSVLARADAL